MDQAWSWKDLAWQALSHSPALLAAWWAYHAKKEAGEVRVHINSRMDELLKSVRAEGRSEGLREGAGGPPESVP